MAKNIDKYLHKDFDKEAGRQHAYKRTKIVATVGPSCDTYEKLLELVKAGVNVFRLNFSHGVHEDKGRIIEFIRQINKTEPYNISVLADLQGPKLRVGEIENGSMTIHEGDILTFTNVKVVGTKERIYVSYPDLHADVQIGEKILIDDGKLEVVVTDILSNGDVKVVVTLGGVLLPKKRCEPARHEYFITGIDGKRSDRPGLYPKRESGLDRTVICASPGGYHRS